MNYEKFASLIGFKKINNIYVNEFDGYKVYFKDYQLLTLNIPSIYIPLDKEIDKEYIKKLTHSVDDNYCAIYGINNKPNIAVVSLIEGNMEKEDVQNKLISEIKLAINTLKNDGYGPMINSPFTGNETPYISYGLDYLPIEEEYRLKKIEEIKSNIVSSPKYRYVISLILSLLFATIGLLPALLLCIYKDYYFTGFVCLMPLGSTLGYYLSKVESKKWIKLTTSLIGIIFIICFSIYSIPHMANARDLSLLKYMKYHKFQGFRKVLFSLLICYSGFGSIKMIEKKKHDYSKELQLFLYDDEK